MSKFLYAFDLSLNCTGLVIFDIETFKPVLVTSFKTNENMPTGYRLHTLRAGVVKEGKPYLPHSVVIEEGFVQHNTLTQREEGLVERNTSTKRIFEVHGVILELFYMYHIKYYPISTVRKVVTGYGKANKQQVKDIILGKHPDVKLSNLDESDAYSIGIAHLITEHGMDWGELPLAPLPKKKSVRKKKVV